MKSNAPAEIFFRVFISIAANLEPEQNIPMALDSLGTRVRLCALSSFFRTAAIERPDQPDYLNGVVLVETSEQPRSLKFELLRPIESSLGRIRCSDKFAARPMDLDILLFGDFVIHEDQLVIPDPDLYTRPYLAAGILELDPDAVVPDTGITIRSIVTPSELQQLAPDNLFSCRLKERFKL